MKEEGRGYPWRRSEECGFKGKGEKEEEGMMAIVLRKKGEGGVRTIVCKKKEE